MHRSPHRIVRLSVLCACACATSGAQSTKDLTITPRNDATQDATATASTEATAPVWREMTWSEYHESVMRNARKRVAIVIWVNGPELRSAPRSKQPSTKTVASEANIEH